MKDFKNKVAVITGSGSGMGRELAIELANAGVLALVEINKETLNETAELLKKYNVGVSKHIVDVEINRLYLIYLKKLLKNMVSRYGFNNAGVALSSTVENSTDEDWEWGLGILLHGVINGTRACTFSKTALRQQLLILLIFGLLSVPNQSIYHVGKYGVRGFTEALP